MPGAMVVCARWVANEDYEADEEGELSFRKGDLFIDVRPHVTERGWSTVSDRGRSPASARRA